MTMTKVRTTIKVNDGLVTSFSRMAWRVLFPRPPFSPPSFSVTTPYVGRSIPDEMEYRYAEHPEGSVANIEKFLPERKKRRQRARRREREGEFTESGRERERTRHRVVCIFGKYNRPAWIDRRRDNWPALVALVCFRSNSRCGRVVEKPLIGAAQRAKRIRPGIYSHNNVRVIAVLDLKCMHPPRRFARFW